jgi:hypothetical protein
VAGALFAPAPVRIIHFAWRSDELKVYLTIILIQISFLAHFYKFNTVRATPTLFADHPDLSM